MPFRLKILLLAYLVFYPITSFADDVMDSINLAIADYKAGNNSKAIENLDYAAQILRQKKGEGVSAVLPEALDGWTAREANSTAIGAGMFGGVNASREYSKAESNVTITIMSDSPMIQSMSMIFSNPAMFGARGQKILRIAGYNSVSRYVAENKEGDIQILVENKYLVTVSGNGVALEDLQKYAEAVNYKALAGLK